MITKKSRLTLNYAAVITLVLITVIVLVFCLYLFPVLVLNIPYDIPFFVTEISVGLQNQYGLTTYVANVFTFILFLLPGLLLIFFSQKLSDILIDQVSPEERLPTVEKTEIELEQDEEENWRTLEMVLKVAIVVIVTLLVVYTMEFLINLDMRFLVNRS